MTSSRSSYALGTAFRAARTLAANPDDLPQVFTLIEALSGGARARLQRRMASSPTGRRLLADQPDVVNLLADREALARLPEGSLGRAYLAFVESENISAEGIRAADAEADKPGAPPPDYAHLRLRDTHDLWHAATGYRGDVLGETALLAFTLAQTRNPAIAVIVAIGMFKMRALPGASGLILDGFRRGRKAAWLPEQEWESLLALPLEDVRQRLSLESTPQYTPLRTSELRAQGALA